MAEVKNKREKDKPKINVPDVEELVTQTPLQGRLLNEWVSTISRRKAKMVEMSLRQALSEGQTLGKAAKSIAPILNQTRSQVMALTRTYYGTVAAQSRDQLWKSNDDLIKGQTWDSILDGHTTINICAPRDQLKYTLDGEPIGHDLPWLGGPGQAHWQCRSHSFPIIRGVKRRVPRQTVGAGKNFEKGDLHTRTGRVRKNTKDARERGILKESTAKPGTTYEQWLRKQPAEFQDDVLGRARGKAFREGTYKLGDKFKSVRPINVRGDEVFATKPIGDDKATRSILSGGQPPHGYKTIKSKGQVFGYVDDEGNYFGPDGYVTTRLRVMREKKLASGGTPTQKSIFNEGVNPSDLTKITDKNNKLLGYQWGKKFYDEKGYDVTREYLLGQQAKAGGVPDIPLAIKKTKVPIKKRATNIPPKRTTVKTPPKVETSINPTPKDTGAPKTLEQLRRKPLLPEKDVYDEDWTGFNRRQPKGYTRFETVAEAQEFAIKNKFAKIVDYTGLDVRAANDINESMLMYLEKFPAMRGKMSRLGNGHRAESDIAMRLVKGNRKIAKADKAAAARRIAMEVNEKMNPMYAYARRGAFLDKTDNDGVFFNPRYFGDGDYHEMVFARGGANHFHTVTGKTGRSTATHEFGHELDYMLFASHRPEIKATYEQFMKLPEDVASRALSKYARTNSAEMIAEAMEEYVESDNPREWAKAIGEFMTNLYKEEGY